MKLETLAKAALDVAGIFTPVAGTVNTVAQLAALLSQLGQDLNKQHFDPATGQPLTLEQASANLEAARKHSSDQDDTIRTNALAALAENEAEAKGGLTS